MTASNARGGDATMIDGPYDPGKRRRDFAGVPKPVVRPITPGDVRDAFAAGMADWRECPLYGMAFGAVYAAAGAVILLVLLSFQKDYLVVPALSAFLLIGPGIALGLYEVSRRLEFDEPLRPMRVVAAGFRHGGGQIAVFGCALLVIAVIWLTTADFIFDSMFGHPGWSVAELVTRVATTPEGLRYALIGTAAGAVFAAITFLSGVIGAPMLLDRDVDAAQACTTSARAVLHSPGAFLLYGFLVTAVIAAGMAAFLVGLLVALPVVGFTTWHLYRRTIGW